MSDFENLTHHRPRATRETLAECKATLIKQRPPILTSSGISWRDQEASTVVARDGVRQRTGLTNRCFVWGLVSTHVGKITALNVVC